MRASRTARAILEEFAAAYPASAQFRGGRKLRRGAWQAVFPDIGRDVAVKTEFLDAVDELCALGVVSTKWKRFREGDELAALFLEDPAAMYRIIEARPPEAVHAAMIAELDGERWSGGRPAEAAACLIALLREKHPLPAADETELRDIGVLLSLDGRTARRSPLRALSVRLFHDSKRLERILPAADRLGRLVWGRPVSDELGLSRSYPEVGLAFRGDIALSGGRAIRLAGEMLTLPLSTVERIEAFHPLSASGFRVLSVENKETFFAAAARLFPDAAAGRPAGGGSFDLLVYVGGHPSPACAVLLRRAAFNGALLHHYGDLDPDGLLIVDEIANLTGAPVQPFAMTEGIYQAYREFGYPLDAVALNRLGRVRHPDLLPLRDAIARHAVGVEQEVIDLSAVMRI